MLLFATNTDLNEAAMKADVSHVKELLPPEAATVLPQQKKMGRNELQCSWT
jgi:hypothetical protein